MQKEVVFEILGAPVGKGRPRFTRSGHAYTPQKTRDYEHRAAVAALAVMSGKPPIVGPVHVRINAYFLIPSSYSALRWMHCRDGVELPCKKPDIDNIIKAVLDACNAVIWQDDAQVTSLSAFKRYDEIPRVVVTVTPVDA